MAEATPPLNEGYAEMVRAVGDIRRLLTTTMDDFSRRLVELEAQVPQPPGTLKRIPARLKAIEDSVPANLNLTKAVGDIANQQKQWETWSQIVQQQTATQAVAVTTQDASLKLIVTALNELIGYHQMDQWRRSSRSERVRWSVNGVLPIMTGALSGICGVYISGTTANTAPAWVLGFIIAGVIVGIWAARWLTADVPPPPNSNPPLTKVTLPAPTPMNVPPPKP